MRGLQLTHLNLARPVLKGSFILLALINLAQFLLDVGWLSKHVKLAQPMQKERLNVGDCKVEQVQERGKFVC